MANTSTASLWSFAGIKDLLLETYNEWSEDQAPRLGASLAFYTMLSIAPLLIVVIAIAGLAFGREAAQGQIVHQIRDMVGTEGAKAIEEMIEGASKKSTGIFASILGMLTLLFGATSVVAELRNAMNTIWDVPQNPDAGIKDLVKERSYALAVVLGCGFLLLVSLVVSAGLAAAGKFMENWLPLPEAVLIAFNFALGLAVVTAVFAILFRVLPDVEIGWHDVLLGAAFTAVLFSLGKLLLGLYIGKASFGSTYGAAGSLVILLVWIYYSSQIFFFGAEFTQVYSRRHGPDPGKRFREWKLRGTTPQQSAPAQAPVSTASRFQAVEAAQGSAVLAPVDGQDGGKAAGLAGSLIGTALAITRIFKGASRGK